MDRRTGLLSLGGRNAATARRIRQAVKLDEIQACRPSNQSRLEPFTPRSDTYAIADYGGPIRSALPLSDFEPIDQPGPGDVNKDSRPGDIDQNSTPR